MKLTFLGLILCTFTTVSLSIKVFNFKKTPTTENTIFSTAKLENIPLESLPRQFVICSSHVQGRITENQHTIFVIYGDGGYEVPWLSIGFWENGILWANFENKYWYMLYQMPVEQIFGWVHICTEVDLDEAVMRTSVNGREVKVMTDESLRSSNIPRLYILLGKVDHGWYQDSFLQFHGKVTNIRVYRELGEVQMEKMTGSPCSSFNLQTFMLWDEMEWEVTGSVELITIKDEIFCSDSNKYNVKIPAEMTYSDAKDACFKLGKGGITEPTLLENMDDSCTYIWTPYTDVEVEDRFINEHTGEIVSNLNWLEGQPNGKRKQNHVAVDMDSFLIDDVDIKKFCVVCSISDSTMLTLRGACQESVLDTTYFPAMVDGQLVYHGIQSVDISYDAVTQQWIALSDKVPDFVAYGETSGSSLLLGPQDWVIHNDSKVCRQKESYRSRLVVTACQETEFTCDSGHCVHMEARCDGRTHCKDGSDEKDCMLVVPPVGYNKFLVPSPFDLREKLSVNVSIDIQKILYIDEVEHFIRMTLTLSKHWFNEHLTFQNLKQDGLNQIFHDDREIVWIPFIEFNTMENTDKCERTQKQEIVQVVPNKNFKYEQNSVSERENAFLFSGLENKMIQMKEISCEFICEFDYKWYPFDTQNCPLIFNMSETDVILRAEMIQYSGDMELLQYFFKNINFCDNVKTGENGILVDITFGRPIISSMMTTFLPTMMLLIISQVSTNLSQSYFDLVIEVNTTVLLVLTTYFIGISRYLPSTGYIKMIDTWMLFTMTYPFLIIIIYSVKEVCWTNDSVFTKVGSTTIIKGLGALGEYKEDNKKGSKIQPRIMRFIFGGLLPLYGLVFTVIFFIVGATNYYYPDIRAKMLC